MSLFAEISQEEMAIALASAIRLMKELLIATGVDPLAVEDLAAAKADELGKQGNHNAALFLRVALGRPED